ncbi:MAG TPA: hypothetical protein VF339_13800 [Gammaproteobacteria bacterium]
MGRRGRGRTVADGLDRSLETQPQLIRAKALPGLLDEQVAEPTGRQRDARRRLAEAHCPITVPQRLDRALDPRIDGVGTRHLLGESLDESSCGFSQDHRIGAANVEHAQRFRVRLDFGGRQFDDGVATEACEQRAADTCLRLDENLRGELRRSVECVRQMRRHEGGSVRPPVVLACLETDRAVEGKTDLYGVMGVEPDVAARLADPQAAAVPAVDSPASGRLRRAYQE